MRVWVKSDVDATLMAVSEIKCRDTGCTDTTLCRFSGLALGGWAHFPPSNRLLTDCMTCWSFSGDVPLSRHVFFPRHLPCSPGCQRRRRRSCLIPHRDHRQRPGNENPSRPKKRLKVAHWVRTERGPTHSALPLVRRSVRPPAIHLPHSKQTPHFGKYCDVRP